MFFIKLISSLLLSRQFHLYNLVTSKPEEAGLASRNIVLREARAEGPSVARLINLSGRAGPSGAKPREFERKIYLYIYIFSVFTVTPLKKKIESIP